LVNVCQRFLLTKFIVRFLPNFWPSLCIAYIQAYNSLSVIRHHFFSERVINIWNSLDNRTVASGSINIFKGNSRKTQTVKRDRYVCWQLMLHDLLRLNRAVGEALPGKLSGKQITHYLQHTTNWIELNVLLYDGTHVLAGLLLCVRLCLTTLNKRI